ncbi:MAG: hypothetical protein PW789_08470 [Edaphobacter sp.]|uniref:hypothetical protein n=1 Tax=Edaphobacter sp. TaxID=1934404 RepID=UPI00238EF8DC|nr:hypothetical protein [Edaphobacter sp.]MDE1176629.1 hypothetical protein [Edaphobacter sp.]
MKQVLQLGLRENRPMWLRVLALVCVLVVTVMSTAQVAHTHAEFSALKQQNPKHNGPSPDDHCPLCVAMHSALAAPQHFTPEPTLSIQRLDSVAVEAERIFRWRFEMASRPPPAQDSI